MVGLFLIFVTGIEVVSQLCLSDGRSIISHNEWWVNAVLWIVGHFSSPPFGCKDPHTSSSSSSLYIFIYFKDILES